MKNVILILLIILSQFNALIAQEMWCNSGDCENGYGTRETKYGAIQVGNFKNGELHGKAKINFKDGDVWEGNFENGKKHGYFEVHRANGNFRKGNFVNNKLNGKGSVKNGEYTYVGQFENDKLHGQGTIKFHTGATYTGGWLNNKRNGQGESVNDDGTASYKGNRLNSKFNGFGIYKCCNGYVYEGEWKDNEKHGSGKETQANGNYYEGNFTNGEQAGAGTCKYTFKDGEKYVGELYDAFATNGTYTFKNGNIYTGDMSNWDANGKGTMKYANGTTKTGTFKDGKYVDPNASTASASNNQPKTKTPCNCSFQENGEGYHKEYYNFDCSGTTGKLTVRETDNTNRTTHYFTFVINGKEYPFKYIDIDIGEYGNQEGKLKTNYHSNDVKLGVTKNEDVAMRWMLEYIFKSDCSKITHDF